MKILSPAKINLFFNTIQKRTDGYHEIESILHTIQLSDIIHLKKAHRFSLSFSHHSTIPVMTADYDLTENNFLEQVYQALKQSYGIDPISIEIEKHIPVGAGLGGGSSNAAACLLGLVHLFQLDLDSTQLLKLAASFGSDTPFFIFGGMAFVSGRGEVIEPCSLALNSPAVIVYPDLVIPTQQAYQENNLLNPNLRFSFRRLKSRLTELAKDHSSSIQEKRNLCETILKGSLYNSFQSPSLAHYPTLKRAWEQLNFFHPSLLSGSGSSLFTTFHDIMLAEKITNSFKKEFRYTFKTELTSRGVQIVN